MIVKVLVATRAPWTLEKTVDHGRQRTTGVTEEKTSAPEQLVHQIIIHHTVSFYLSSSRQVYTRLFVATRQPFCPSVTQSCLNLGTLV